VLIPLGRLGRVSSAVTSIGSMGDDGVDGDIVPFPSTRRRREPMTPSAELSYRSEPPSSDVKDAARTVDPGGVARRDDSVVPLPMLAPRKRPWTRTDRSCVS
jgi:hypothetical protein